MKIIGIGNALVDILARMRDDSLLKTLSLPKGSMTLVDEERANLISKAMQAMHPVRSTGGSVGNTMLALAHLQASPGFIGMVGQDETGLFYMQNCEEVGIDAHLIKRPGHTGIAYTLISPDGERTFGTYLGAAAMLSSSDIVPELFSGYDLLHVEGYLVQNHELMETVAREAKAAGLRLSLDLSSYNVVRDHLDFFRHLVETYSDIIFANEEEIIAYSGQENCATAVDFLRDSCRTFVVKLWSKGACAIQQDENAFIQANRIQAVDTTGAGDFFAAGFLYAMSCGASLEGCLRSGARLSELVIQVMGTRLPEEKWKEIRNGL